MEQTMMDAVAAELLLAERRLKYFIEQAWHVLEPSTEYIDGWHIDAICEHLEAITFNQITRLIINVPPRHMKSISVVVMWPAWEWGPMNMPHVKWLCASYADTLSTRDSLKCRRLIQSPWYQRRWGHRFQLTGDQNQKTRFDNSHNGYRLATSVRGVGTGEGGDRIIVDDPHNVIKGESSLDRLTTLTWWDESMSTRINHPTKSSRIIIMQRVADKDLTGHILAKDLGYEHLVLPARYEKNHQFPVSTSILKKDPRKEEGEPLWPKLYDDAALSKLEKEMTEYSRAGQLQQRPQPRGGGIFKVDAFVLLDKKKIPHHTLIKKVVRYWDKAGTDGGGARTAGVLMLQLKPGVKWNDIDVLVVHVKKGQWSSGKREAIIKQTAVADDQRWPNIKVHQIIEREPGSGGKESAENTIRNLAGHVVKEDIASVHKETRSEPYQAANENGRVGVLIDEWTQEFLDEHETAPKGEFKDQWDAASGAYRHLYSTKNQKTAGTWG